VKKKKVFGYEDEPEALDLTVGSFNSFTEVPPEDKPQKKKPQIGFIRPKKLDKPKKK
jgi:hypothetical protein